MNNEYPICPCCEKPTYLKSFDLGIGETEYWGFSQSHSDMRMVTACCEVEIEYDLLQTTKR